LENGGGGYSVEAKKILIINLDYGVHLVKGIQIGIRY